MKEPLSFILIDDSASSNLYHKVMMEDAGINVDTDVKEFISCNAAKGYLQGLFKVSPASDFPNIILLDINIPVVNGWEMVEFLESVTLDHFKPKVYMVSNSRSPRDLERAETHPIVIDILEKHLEVDFFAKLIKAHSGA